MSRQEVGALFAACVAGAVIKLLDQLTQTTLAAVVLAMAAIVAAFAYVVTTRPRERRAAGASFSLAANPAPIFGAVLLMVLLSNSYVAVAATHKTAKQTAAVRRAAPRLLSPASSARVVAVPAFSWAPVRGAAQYEFQIAADSRFESILAGPGHGSFKTASTYASIDKTMPDGTYYWRARAIDMKGKTGRWSSVRSLVKGWSAAPALHGPAPGANVTYPGDPLVLRWSAVPYAYKYLLTIATDPALAHSALGDRTPSVETSGTTFALPNALARGTYYWAVTPLDAGKHPGTPSGVSSFTWSWPTATATRVSDLRNDARSDSGVLYDPQFSWDPVPGAAQYQVEVNPSQDFAAGSRVCCDEVVLGTSLSPKKVLPNNTYYWRVRAVDADGNAGDWNAGPAFRKDFDATVPAVPGLRVRDNRADAAPPPGPTLGLPTTDSPVIAWDPVPGASSYEVNVVPWDNDTGGCNWGTSDTRQRWSSITAATSWTPLASSWNGVNPAGRNAPGVSLDSGHGLVDGNSYCVQVRARADRDASSRDVRGDWTQVGGDGQPAFTYRRSPQATCTSATAMTAGSYHAPSDTRRTPLLTWEPVAGACAYYVVVARDPDLTNIVDVALTTQPAYAPRQSSNPVNYTDETTSYYWAVVPTKKADGSDWSFLPTQNHPQPFEKRSLPPRLLGPGVGADVYAQPTFRWTLPTDDVGRPEGVRNYRIQVDDDPSFGSPIDDVTTDSTGYTSTSTYPADTVLYWRVRADVESAAGTIGLAWSPVGTFRRRLPAPAPSPNNPTSGQGIPMFSWSPVDGAVSYDMHVEQSDGTKRDFNMRSTAFTPVVFYGTGIWRWQVRANFKGVSRSVSSGYTPLAPFARRIDTPAGLRTTKVGSRALLSWDPPGMARQYRVEISTTDSFSSVIESATTENTNYAPRMSNPTWTTGEPLYWRVAALDEGLNIGAWASSPIRQGAKMRVRAHGAVRLRHTRRIRVTVTDAKRHPIKDALVRIIGAGSGKAKRTSRKGTVVLRVKGTKKGKVTFRAEKRGYLPTATTLRVR
jgi:hypothetical protein